MDALFISKFKEVIREEVAKNNRVKIEGLGEFQKVHQKQKQEKHKNGRIVVLPPKDIIEFKPENKTTT